MALNKTVEQMEQINLTGFITPPEWYMTIQTKTAGGKAKPHHLAIAILSRVCYWYRPAKKYDESGKLISKENKFHGEELQKSYKQLEEELGVSKRVIGEACRFLQNEIGVLELKPRDVKTNTGTFQNVMFMDINIKKLKEITFIDLEKYKKQSVVDEVVKSTEYEKTKAPSTKKRTRPIQKNVLAEYRKEYEADTEKGTIYIDYYRNHNIDYYKTSVQLLVSFFAKMQNKLGEDYDSKIEKEFFKKQVRKLYLRAYDEFHKSQTDEPMLWSGEEGSIQGRALNGIMAKCRRMAKAKTEDKDFIKIEINALYYFVSVLTKWEDTDTNGNKLITDHYRNRIDCTDLNSNLSKILRMLRNNGSDKVQSKPKNSFRGNEGAIDYAERLANKSVGY